MKRTVIALTTVLALGAVALVTDAHPRQGARGAQGTRGEGAGAGIIGRLPALQAELGLTDQQVAQIRASFAELREKNAQYRDSLRAQRGDIADTLLANPQNLEQAMELQQKRAAMREAMQENRMAATARALSVLTPEQRTKLSTRLSERGNRRGPCR